MNFKGTIIAAVAAFFIPASSVCWAGEKPPVDALPLCEIVQAIEEKGYSPITEISMDDGVWEGEVYKGDEKLEMKVKPADGSIISDRIDD